MTPAPGVLWLTPTYPWPRQPADGVFYRTQARALAALDVDLIVAVPTPWAPPPLPLLRERWRLHAAAPDHGMDGAVRILRPRYTNVPGQPSWSRPDRLIANAVLRRRADWRSARLVHGHYAVTGLAAWRLASSTGLPFLMTFHGSDMNTWPDDHPDRRRDLATAARSAAAVLAVSGALADRVREVTGVDAITMPIGIDHAGLSRGWLSRQEARDRLQVRQDAFMALYIGNLLPAKGVRELVDAVVERDRETVLLLVGDGPENGYRARDAAAVGRLRYEGAKAHEGIGPYLAAADVLVLASRREGLPTVLVEAGAVGVPVVATRVGGIPELLGDDRGTLLPDGSASAIAAALKDVRNHPETAQAATSRLRDHVVENYDVAKNAAALVELYRRVLR